MATAASGRCKACTSNDLDALAEEVAERMWERHRDREIDGAWENAGSYWHMVMISHARATLEVITADRT